MYDSLLLHLALFIGWTIFLLVLIELARVWLMYARGYAVTSFPAGERHGPDAYWRLYRAQANCLEFLPFYAALILLVVVSGHDIPHMFRIASMIIVCVRPFQSIVHIISTTAIAIQLRASLFLIQLSALVVMCGVAIHMLIKTFL